MAAAAASASAAEASTEEGVAGSVGEHAGEDVFEKASQAFREAHAKRPRAPRVPVSATEPGPISETFAPSTTKRSFGRRIAAGSATVGVMGAVGLLALAMGAPAEAVAAAGKTVPVTSIQVVDDESDESTEVQAFVTPGTVRTEITNDVASESYSIASLSELAASVGITRPTDFFTNDPNGKIQWPFAVGVSISDGYGPRWGSFHYGLDFTPGDGAEIQAVAEGTVRIADEAGGAFGVHVMIDHVIDGEVFSTHYAHMQYGSLRVKQGDYVTPGTILGLTGDTGLSYGAHLHFEVYVAGQRIDPLPWLREHAGG